MRYFAFYLPQFYPFAENDFWWGRGFTEWTNVTKATPLFEGHYQPHLPTELGFYDLRLREAQRSQIALAKAHAIDGFCFHYYWFGGKRLLDVPVDGFLNDRSADFPFCLCFANENWTRAWDGADREVLIRQEYAAGWEDAFVDGILPYLRDERYIRVNGNPLLVIYRPQQFPDPRASAIAIRRAARARGVGELHLCAALVHGNWDFEGWEFDAGIEFPPHNVRAPNLAHRIKSRRPLTGNVFSFADVAAGYLEHNYEARRVYRAVFPCWDNSARAGWKAQLILDGVPENYEIWLSQATEKTRRERIGDEQIVFINAWNEWAEGCHLEPDIRFGRGFLEATARAKSAEHALSTSGFRLDQMKRLTGRDFIAVDGSPPFVRRVKSALEHFPLVQKSVAVVYRRTREWSRRIVRRRGSVRRGPIQNARNTGPFN